MLRPVFACPFGQFRLFALSVSTSSCILPQPAPHQLWCPPILSFSTGQHSALRFSQHLWRRVDPFFLLPLSSHLEFTRPPSGRRPPLLRRPPASSNHLRSRNIARLIEQCIHAFQESHRMRQSCVQLKRRLIHPPRMYENQPPVPHRLEGVNTQAALLLPRRPCHLAQGLLHRTLFSRTRVQPHKRILLHGSLHLPTS